MQLYALTEDDVTYIGNAAAVAGGFVTAWGDEDNGSALPAIIRHKTGRPYIGTMPGVDAARPIPPETVQEILSAGDADIASHGSQHPIVLAGTARTRMWMDLIRGAI